MVVHSSTELGLKFVAMLSNLFKRQTKKTPLILISAELTDNKPIQCYSSYRLLKKTLIHKEENMKGHGKGILNFFLSLSREKGLNRNVWSVLPWSHLILACGCKDHPRWYTAPQKQPCLADPGKNSLALHSFLNLSTAILYYPMLCLSISGLLSNFLAENSPTLILKINCDNSQGPVASFTVPLLSVFGRAHSTHVLGIPYSCCLQAITTIWSFSPFLPYLLSTFPHISHPLLPTIVKVQFSPLYCGSLLLCWSW